MQLVGDVVQMQRKIAVEHIFVLFFNKIGGILVM
jgi:hypothetical protein